MSIFDQFKKVQLCGICGKNKLPEHSEHLFCDDCINRLVEALNPNTWDNDKKQLTPVGELLLDFVDTISIVARKAVEDQQKEEEPGK
jgi:hypothetical protein